MARSSNGGAQRVPDLPGYAEREVVDSAELLPPEHPVQLLRPDGTFTPHPDWPVELDDDARRDLYRHMVVTRRLDKEAINLQRQGQLGVYASGLGQEAAQIGSAYAMDADDWVFPTYREKGVERMRGIDPAGKLEVERGTWLSGYDAYEHRVGLTLMPVATQLLHAVGFAMASKSDGQTYAVMTYVGDGGTSTGDFHEAMNFAAVYEVPCVFFVQNNGWAISLPHDEQCRAPSLAHKGIGYGMPGYRVDGNDVLASYVVAKHALDRARAGKGPAIIEALTYRMEAHTTSDDPTRYRQGDDLDVWGRYDPITRMERYLRDQELLDDEYLQKIEDEASQACARVRERLYEAPHGDPFEMFEHVYVDPPRDFEEQSEQLRLELQAEEVDA